MGYKLAGYEVVGVDKEWQRRYPFKFICRDAVEYLVEHGREYDLVHASPPCQGYSKARYMGGGGGYSDLVGVTRDALEIVGVPYVIENVPGSPLYKPIRLCGLMFGLRVYRHRLFESSLELAEPRHIRHEERVAPVGRRLIGEGIMSVVGHFSGVERAREAMGIEWMSRNELAQAVPPSYTKYIGEQLWDRVVDRKREREAG